MIVQLGCGDGRLTAALGAADGFLVQGLDSDPANVDAARKYLQGLGVYGRITVDRLPAGSTRLPYIDNLVNLVVAEDLGAIPMDEVMRVLCPGGVAYVKQEQAGAAAVLQQDGLTADDLSEVVLHLIDNADKLERMGRRAAELSLPDAASRIAQLIKRSISRSDDHGVVAY